MVYINLIHLPLVCLAKLLFNSHFSIICDTLPPNTVITFGTSQITPWHTSSPSLLNNSFVPGGVLILKKDIGLVSRPVHIDLPSCKVSFSIRGADDDSSLALGADTFLIFWIWTTTGLSNFEGSLVKSSGSAASPISLKSYWKITRILFQKTWTDCQITLTVIENNKFIYLHLMPWLLEY